MRSDLIRSARTMRRCDQLLKAAVPVLLLTLGGTALLALLAEYEEPAAVAAQTTALMPMYLRADHPLNTTAHPFTRPPVADLEMEGQRTTRYVESPLGNYWVTTWEDEGRFRFKYDDGTYSDWIDMDEGLKVVEDETEGYYTQWV